MIYYCSQKQMKTRQYCGKWQRRISNTFLCRFWRLLWNLQALCDILLRNSQLFITQSKIVKPNWFNLQGAQTFLVQKYFVCIQWACVQMFLIHSNMENKRQTHLLWEEVALYLLATLSTSLYSISSVSKKLLYLLKNKILYFFV